MGSRRAVSINTQDPTNPFNQIASGNYTIVDDRTLADAQAEVTGRLGSYFNTIIGQGLVISGNTYQIDDNSRSLMLQTYNQPSPISWITMDNKTMSFTSAQFQAGCLRVNSYYNAMVLNARTHKNNILALVSVAACDAYDITTGWPT